MSLLDKNLDKKIMAALKEMREQVIADGGDFELEKLEKGTLSLKIKGACMGCPMAAITFGSAMEEVIKKKVPEVKRVKVSTE